MVTTQRLLTLALIAFPGWAQTCATSAPLSPNDSKSGQLDSGSCRLPDGTAVAEYAVIFPVRGTLQLTAKGTGFTPALILRNEMGQKIDGGSASVTHYMEAGAHRVLVNASTASAGGKFTLASVFTPEPNILCRSSGSVGAGQSISAQLSNASCKLPDNSAYDNWQITIYGSGTLNISMSSADFDSYLILRGDNGAALAQDDNSGGGLNAQISIPVSGNATYSIIAAAADPSQKPGRYQLSTSFTPDADQNCVPLAVISGASLQLGGSVSDSSCVVNLPGRDDAALFNYYTVHVTASGQAQIQVPSSTFTPLLLLLDANGNEIAEDLQSGGPFTPTVFQQLDPGDYQLLVFDEDSFSGDYTLQYSFTEGPPTPCAVQGAPTDGSALSGTLAANSSCRASGLLADTYRITLPAAGSLDATLSSGDFSAFLEIRDAKNNLVNYGDQTADGSSAHLSLALPAGTYFVLASSADLPGSYLFSAGFTQMALPSCATTQALAVNTGFVGVLNASDCQGSNGQAVDAYKFTTTADSTVAAFMNSTDIATELTLTDSAGKELRSDSGSYTLGNSVIVQYLKAGTYRLEARSADLRSLGQYRVDTLVATGPKPAFCVPANLAIGIPQTASLSYTSCQYSDGTFSDFYQFQVADGTNPVNITAASTDFNALLVLMDSRGNWLASDDNSAGGQNALLSVQLDPGIYVLVVKPSDQPSSSGRYTVTVQQ